MLHTSFLRCRYILSKNAHVFEALKALFTGNPINLGRLATSTYSHHPQVYVGCEHLDSTQRDITPKAVARTLRNATNLA